MVPSRINSTPVETGPVETGPNEGDLGSPTLTELGPFAAINRRPPPGGARREWQRARVLEVRPETDRAKTFRLGLPRWSPHVPGQHYVVRLTAPDGYTASRDYSVASAPADTGVIELTVDRLDDGEVSAYLNDTVEVGDEIEVRGPFGGFFVWRGDRPALLVGGGSGVVPLMAMVRHSRRVPTAALSLVVSVRSPTDLFYAQEYGEETTIVYTRQSPVDGGRVGRLTADLLTPLVRPGIETYVCGSNSFAESASRLLVEAGQPAEHIRVERFGDAVAIRE